ncbi:MAG TPA: hypothetical protein VHB74_08295 [Devosia sp.]|nr:hypothetical protein [Devosia sp.]
MSTGPTTAAERLAALDDLDPAELVGRTGDVLARLVEIMDAETTLLHAHRYTQAGQLSAEKTQLAQDYVGLARAVQRRLPQLEADVPEQIARLKRGHDSLVTQMAENLRVIATSRDVAETLLADVATSAAGQERAKTYDQAGMVLDPSELTSARGIAVNRAL